MKRKQFSLILCFMVSLVMTAAHITPEQARHVAVEFVKSRFVLAGDVNVQNTLQVRQYSSENNANARIYAVNLGTGKGFVLVGDNGLSDEVIGYCDHGTFDEQQMPANMRSWLDCYVATASRVKDFKQVRSLQAAGQYPTKTPIAPLLECKWNQNKPYNNECPMLDGKQSPTGCTITAMAQIMYYHRWPKGETTAIPGFTPDNSGGTNHPTLPALEPTTFDWDKMYPTYDNNEDGSEVAKLMKYLGTASHALYGKSETAAYGYNALQAIIQYFNYDAGAYAMWRRQLSYNQWVDKLYAELQAKRPVLFSGTAPDNAHTFVVDGYDEEDFFHINWGWGGSSDGYYRVLLMDPKEQGTGGSASNEAYSLEQVAYFGVQPSTGEQAHEPRLAVLSNWIFTDPQGTGNYETHSSEYTSTFFEGNGYLVYAAMNSYNFNSISAEFSLGCRVIKNDGSVTRDYEWDPATLNVDAGLNDHSKTVYLNPLTDPALTDGDYKLYFTSKLKSATTWLLDEGSDDHYIDIHLDHAGGKLIATSVSREAKLTVNEVTIHTATPTVGQPVNATITVSNNGTATYHGDMGLTQTQDEGDNQWLNAKSCDIAPGATVNIDLTFKPKKAGTVNYKVYDNTGNELYAGSFIVAESNITSDIPLTVTHMVTNASGTVIHAPKALIDVTVTNDNDKTYQGEITIYCYKWTGEQYKFVYDSRVETIPAHQTVVLHRESPELTGADFYSFNTMYMKGEEQVEQETNENYYTTGSYYLTYDSGGKATTHLVTEPVQPDATVCAVDLTNAPEINSVNSAANPNMIIIVAENSTLTGTNIVKGTEAQEVKLIEGYPFYTPKTFTASNISYTCTPTANFDIQAGTGWGTIVLPFAATSCQATVNGAVTPLNWSTTTSTGDIVLATYNYENAGTMEFGLPDSNLEACHPYLLGIPATINHSTSLAGAYITFSSSNTQVMSTKAVVTGRDYKMIGTFAPAGGNIFVLNAEGSAFVPGTAVNPFHAYFTPIGSISPATTLVIGMDNGSSTAIGEITVDTTDYHDVPIYNINGQRVTRPGKGIYIIKGKKVIF